MADSEGLDIGSDELWEALEVGTLGMWRWDVVQDHIEWSPALCRTLGVDPDRDSFPDVSGFIHADDRAHQVEAIRKFLENPNGVYAVDARFRFADGEFHWATARAIGWLGDDGRVVKLVGWLVEISERHAKRDSRAKEEARGRQLLDRCPAPFVITDLAERVLYVNDAAVALAERPRAALIGHRATDLVPESMAAWMVETDQRALVEGPIIREVATLELHEGRQRQILFTKWVVHTANAERSWIACFLLDITDEQRSHARSGAVDRLDSLGLLAGGVAHDLNNLLTIVGATVDSIDGGTTDRAEGYETILGVTERASAICRSLLAHAGREGPELRLVDLGRVGKSFGQLLEKGFAGGSRLEVHVGADTPVVSADPTQLSRVLLNLAQNAYEADARSIVIELDEHAEAIPTEGLRVPVDRGPPYGRLVVRDDGPGIPADALDQIFEPFHTDKASGTGLGLAVVEEVVRQHGGALRVASRPGETRFEIYLPGVRAPAPQQARKSAPGSLSGWRVLVVDDDALVGRLASGLLRKSGAAASVVNSGPAALARIAAHADEIDAVLLDLTMPGMSGVQVLERIRRDQPEMPVVVSSGFGRDAVTGGLRPGRELFLPKPYSADELARTLSSVLSGSARGGVRR